MYVDTVDVHEASMKLLERPLQPQISHYRALWDSVIYLFIWADTDFFFFFFSGFLNYLEPEKGTFSLFSSLNLSYN